MTPFLCISTVTTPFPATSAFSELISPQLHLACQSSPVVSSHTNLIVIPLLKTLRGVPWCPENKVQTPEARSLWPGTPLPSLSLLQPCSVFFAHTHEAPITGLFSRAAPHAPPDTYTCQTSTQTSSRSWNEGQQSAKAKDPRSSAMWVWISALPPCSFVTLGRIFNPLYFCFLICKTTTTYLTWLLWKLFK